MPRKRRPLRSGFTSAAPTLLTALGLLLGSSPLITAQKSSATCGSSWDWAQTKSGDSPCLVAAKLLSLCDSSSSGGEFTLQSGGFYTPSTSSEAAIEATTCACNVVAYNLLSACQSCQASGAASPLSWSSYAAACPTCSFEGGIVPGPCGPMASVGFPSSVKPDDMDIVIPAWAYYNSSGGSWDVDDAKDAAGGDTTTISPVSTPTSASSTTTKSSSPTSTKATLKSSDNDSSTGPAPMSTGMKAAVISCSLAAGLIATLFITYLVQLCRRKRQQKQLKKLTDETFEKVVPAVPSGKDAKTPVRSAFKRVMSRLTLATVPKTPLFSPGTPAWPRTPKTAFLRHFPIGNPFSPKKEKSGDAALAVSPDSSPAASSKGDASFSPDAKLGLMLDSANESRHSVASSRYSEYDSYKPPSQRNASRAGSVRSYRSNSETVTTGSVKAKSDVQLLNPFGSLPAAGTSHASLAPSIMVSSADGSELVEPGRKELRAARVKSQTAKISRWSDSTGELGAIAPGHSWSRVPSMASNRSASPTPSMHSGRSGSAAGMSESVGSSALMLPPKAKTRTPNRSQLPSSVPTSVRSSSTLDLNETLVSPGPASEVGDDVGSQAGDEERREERSSNSSMASMLRRVRQLDFGDSSSNPATPHRVRFSTKSTKSRRTVNVPPSPSGSNLGFAL